MDIKRIEPHPAAETLKARLTVPEIAKTLGITVNYAYQVLRGDVAPSAALGSKINQLKDIVMSENEKPNWPDEATKEEFQGDWATYQAYLEAERLGKFKIHGRFGKEATPR